MSAEQALARLERQTLGAIDSAGIAAMIPEVFRYVETVATEGALPGVETRPATASIVTRREAEAK